MTNSTLSTMFIGMMMFCTTNSFAQSYRHETVRHHDAPRTEVVVVNDRHHDYRDRRHNEYRRNSHHNTWRDNRRTEVVVVNEPVPCLPPAPAPRTYVQRSSTGNVVAGMVAGAVIGGIVSAIAR